MESANTCGNFPFLGNKLVVAVDLDDIPCSPPTSDLGSFLNSDPPKSIKDPYRGVYENRQGITIGADGNYLRFSHKFTRERSFPSLTLSHRGVNVPTLLPPLTQDHRSLSLAELIISVSQSLPGTPLASPGVSPSSTPNIHRKTLSVSRLYSCPSDIDHLSKTGVRTRGKSETLLSTNQLTPPISEDPPLIDPASPDQAMRKKADKPRTMKVTNRDMNFLAPQSM